VDLFSGSTGILKELGLPSIANPGSRTGGNRTMSQSRFGPQVGLLLVLFTLPHAAQGRTREAPGGPGSASTSLTPFDPSQELVPPRALQTVEGFGPNVAAVGPAGLPDGTELLEPLGIYGLRVLLDGDLPPVVWTDLAPRRIPAAGDHALYNPGGGVLQPRQAQREHFYVARLTFEVPVNRATFELRALDQDYLSVLVSAWRGGVELGTRFFDVGRDFTLVGLETPSTFDELRVEFTNPPQGLFSLGTIVHELDLRDRDGDGWPDFCDLCPFLASRQQLDTDGDGIGDLCDAYPEDPDNDLDGDGIGQPFDNCPEVFNPDQADWDLDGLGDRCDLVVGGPDADGDGVPDATDNCPDSFNPAQVDCDGDGIGDVCDPTLIDPAEVSFTMGLGECATVVKSICLPPSPPKVDIVILFDTTGSMGGEILTARNNAAQFVVGVRNALPFSDIRFGLVSMRDYPATYDSCGYAAEYSRAGDEPFRVEAPIGSPDPEVLNALNNLTPFGGRDQPEAYTRALWEISQPDSGIGFRPGAARFVLLIGDAPPHDCDVSVGLEGCLNGPASSGRDPGRDATLFTPDDLDFQQDALRGLRATNTKVLAIYSWPVGFCIWDRFARYTGGVAVHADSSGGLPPGTNLSQLLIDLIRFPTIERVDIVADNPCGLDITFDPPFILGPIDVTSGAKVIFEEQICVPDQLPPGVDSLDCTVTITADGTLIGTQSVHVDVPCPVLDFEGLPNGHSVLLSDFLAQGIAVNAPPAFNPSNFGPAIFDTTPGGPNDPSQDNDLLVGLGNALILQSVGTQTVPGIFDHPNDSANGGRLVFHLGAPAQVFSVDLIDIDVAATLRTTQITLEDEFGRTRTYSVPDEWTNDVVTEGPPGWATLDLTTLLPQPGFRSTATAVEDPGFDSGRVLRVTFDMAGSGAIDNLKYCF
jgi:hypothetical protein